MAAFGVSNPVENSSNLEREKSQSRFQSRRDRWRTDAEHRSYSANFLRALRRVRRRSSAPSSPSDGASPPTLVRARAVRDAANRALAEAAKGRTRWSRAILANRRKLKFRKRAMKVRTAAAAAGAASAVRVKGRVPGRRNGRFLGRLVPGCRGEAFPAILEEAIDYIPALEMQIRAMTTVLELLSSAPATEMTPSAPSTEMTPSARGGS